jgi:hypothetical protein
MITSPCQEGHGSHEFGYPNQQASANGLIAVQNEPPAFNNCGGTEHTKRTGFQYNYGETW